MPPKVNPHATGLFPADNVSQASQSHVKRSGTRAPSSRSVSPDLTPLQRSRASSIADASDSEPDVQQFEKFRERFRGARQLRGSLPQAPVQGFLRDNSDVFSVRMNRESKNRANYERFQTGLNLILEDPFSGPKIRDIVKLARENNRRVHLLFDEPEPEPNLSNSDDPNDREALAYNPPYVEYSEDNGDYSNGKGTDALLHANFSSIEDDRELMSSVYHEFMHVRNVLAGKVAVSTNSKGPVEGNEEAGVMRFENEFRRHLKLKERMYVSNFGENLYIIDNREFLHIFDDSRNIQIDDIGNITGFKNPILTYALNASVPDSTRHDVVEMKGAGQSSSSVQATERAGYSGLSSPQVRNLFYAYMPAEAVIEVAGAPGSLPPALRERMIGDLASDMGKYGEQPDVRDVRALSDDALKALYKDVHFYHQNFPASGTNAGAMLKLVLNSHSIGTVPREPASKSSGSRGMNYPDRKKEEQATWLRRMDEGVQMYQNHAQEQRQRKEKKDRMFQNDRMARVARNQRYETDESIANAARARFEESQPRPESSQATKRSPASSRTTAASSSASMISSPPITDGRPAISYPDGLWRHAGQSSKGASSSSSSSGGTDETPVFEQQFRRFNGEFKTIWNTMVPVENDQGAKAAAIVAIDQLFRRLSIEHHPDKSGSVESFKALSAARDAVIGNNREPRLRP
jgi:hypothetical protein